MLKIRRPLGRLIFNMGIAIPGKTVFLIETAPWCYVREHQKVCGFLGCRTTAWRHMRIRSLKPPTIRMFVQQLHDLWCRITYNIHPSLCILQHWSTMFNAVAPAPNPLPADKPPIKDDDDPMAEHYPPAPTGDPPPDLYSTPSGEPPAHQYPLPQEKYPPAPTGDLHPDLYSTPAEQPPQHRYPELLDHYPRPHKFGHFEVPPQQQVMPVIVQPKCYAVKTYINYAASIWFEI